MTPNQREDMDRDLDLIKKFEPLNRRAQDRDLFFWGSWIVGSLATVCLIIVVIAQIVKVHHG